jgi:hypothetical protein
MFNNVWHNLYLLTSQHRPMFGVRLRNHHQLAGCTVKLHSSSSAWSPLHVHSLKQLLATLASWENQSLWKHLRIDGGAGDWIFSGLMRGLLVIGHDGSYMPHLTNNICACAAVFYCSHTNQYADVTWVEKSTKKAAYNYPAKIWGGVQYTADY